jgi:beta-lactam-binding protein with PASTA domain
VRVSLKAVPGMDTVNVSLEKGLATVTLKPGNTTTLKQLQDAIAKNGFTMKQSDITAIGKVINTRGKPEFQITGSNDVLQLIPDGQHSGDASAVAGESVIAAGIVPEASKGKSPDALRFRSLQEQK